MNILKKVTQNGNKLVFGLAVTLLMLTSSCVSKTAFLTSEVIPAARGYVTVKQDKNSNYLIRLELDYLAESTRLKPSRQLYVIWMESDQKTTKNIGQIHRTSNSNKLDASFETASSVEPTRIFISAEDDGTVSNPGSQIVLTTGRLKG